MNYSSKSQFQKVKYELEETKQSYCKKKNHESFKLNKVCFDQRCGKQFGSLMCSECHKEGVHLKLNDHQGLNYPSNFVQLSDNISSKLDQLMFFSLKDDYLISLQQNVRYLELITKNLRILLETMKQKEKQYERELNKLADESYNQLVNVMTDLSLESEADKLKLIFVELSNSVYLENKQLQIREDFLKPAQDRAKSSLDFEGDRCEYYIQRVLFDLKQGLNIILKDSDIQRFETKFAFFSDEDYKSIMIMLERENSSLKEKLGQLQKSPMIAHQIKLIESQPQFDQFNSNLKPVKENKFFQTESKESSLLGDLKHLQDKKLILEHFISDANQKCEYFSLTGKPYWDIDMILVQSEKESEYVSEIENNFLQDYFLQSTEDIQKQIHNVQVKLENDQDQSLIVGCEYCNQIFQECLNLLKSL